MAVPKLKCPECKGTRFFYPVRGFEIVFFDKKGNVVVSKIDVERENNYCIICNNGACGAHFQSISELIKLNKN